MKPSIGLAALLFLNLWGCAAARPIPSVPTESTDIDALLDSIVREEKIPGMAAAVIREDGSILAGATGTRKLGTDDPIRIDDRFHIGSVGKPITATMIATLVDEGKLQWTSKVSDVLPQCSATMNAAYRSVTLAHLLAHESGLPPFGDEEEIAKVPPGTGSPMARRLSFSCYALSVPPIVTPTTEKSYSNAGFVVAGSMAEAVTGESWEDLVMQRVIRPLHLSTTIFGWPARNSDEPFGHWLEKDMLVPVDPNGSYQLPVFIAPAGNLSMSMPDLARFLGEHLSALHGTSTLLRQETARQMHTRRIAGGLGWGVQLTLLGHANVSTHEGSAGTFETIVAVFPDAGVAIAITANAGDEVAGKAARSTLKQLAATFAPAPATPDHP